MLQPSFAPAVGCGELDVIRCRSGAHGFTRHEEAALVRIGRGNLNRAIAAKARQSVSFRLVAISVQRLHRGVEDGGRKAPRCRTFSGWAGVKSCRWPDSVRVRLRKNFWSTRLRPTPTPIIRSAYSSASAWVLKQLRSGMDRRTSPRQRATVRRGTTKRSMLTPYPSSEFSAS